MAAEGERTGAISRVPLEHWRLATHFVFSADLPFNYLVNPKSACSTILEHLWAMVDRRRGTSTFTGSPHRGAPWDQVAELSAEATEIVARKPTVSMVRNPYARTLSAYLSKVGDRRADEDQYIWNVFRKRFDLAEDAVPSFAQYLDFIEADPPEQRDRHWATQASNLLQPWAPVDRIFYLEHFAFFEAYLEAFGAGGVTRSQTGFRGADALFETYLTPEISARIAKLYAVDFETFGYSLDPRIQAPVRPVDRLAGHRIAFAQQLASYAKPVFFGAIDKLHGREMAGWFRAAGDPAALSLVFKTRSRQIPIPFRASDHEAGVYFFNMRLPVVVTPRNLLDGHATVLVRGGADEHVFRLWDPIRLAGEVSAFEPLMLERFHQALPRAVRAALQPEPEPTRG